MSRVLQLDPKLGENADPRHRQLWTDAAIVTRNLQAQILLGAPLASPTFTGTVTLPTPFTVGAVSVTATGTEINLLDGVTATTAELNILDGVTATAAEINLLDGITALAAGTYTPTVTASTNVGTVSGRQGQYQRINNTVTVSGQAVADTSGSGTSAVFITLPVSSTLTTEQQCCGAGCWYNSSSGFGVVRIISGTSNRAQLLWTAVAEEQQVVTFHFTYLVA
jgi:hypothetical protein